MEAQKHQGEIQTLIDKMSSAQKIKHLLAWPLYKNGNVVYLTFTCSMDHPEIAEETKAFFAPSGTSSALTVGVLSGAITNGTPGGTPNLNGFTI